jgi:hypothetical protein
VKRLFAFLLLVVVGALVLRFTIGDELMLPTQPTEAKERQPQGRSGAGVDLKQGHVGATWQMRGAFRYSSYRPIALPGGGQRNEQVYLLEAEDSQPVREGVQQLDRVTVTLFDRGKPAATVRSRQAFVELGRDLGDKPSVREDKEIDLRDAVFTTLPDSRMPGLRLELGNARVLVTDDVVQLRTADETDPVLLVLDGKNRGTLRGKGLQARFPRARSSSMQRADVDVLHEPEFDTEGLSVRAKGRLHYAEDTATGAAELVVDDDVQVGLELKSGLRLPGRGLGQGKPTANPAQPTEVRIRGDQLVASLRRGKQRAPNGELREDLGWTALRLRGSPARIDGAGLDVNSPNIEVLRGGEEEPFVVTASGGPSRIEYTPPPEGQAKGDTPIVGTSPRRIHLLRPGVPATAAYQAFGFPQWTLRGLDQPVIALEGAAEIGSNGSSTRASQGLRLLVPHPSSSAVVAQGFGEVHIDQKGRKANEPDLIANGSDGFLLLARDGRETLDLGPRLPADTAVPDHPWRTHRYDLRRGNASMHGVGACRVERDGLHTVLTLRAPGSEIEGQLDDRTGRLSAVRSLRAELEDERPIAVLLTGLPAMATFVRDGEVTTAEAPVLEQTGPGSLCLLPPKAELDATLWHGLAEGQTLPRLTRHTPAARNRGAADLAATAPRIDLHHVGGNDVLVDVQGLPNVPAHATGTIGLPDRPAPTALELDAARFRLLPYGILPAAVQAHTASAGLAAEAPFFALQSPWLLAERVSKLVVDDAEQGHVEGAGHRLVLNHGAEAGLFLGDAESMEPATVTRLADGRSVTATGARVRVFRESTVRLQALRTFPGRSVFLLPTVVLHQPEADNALAHVRAICRGDIDVLPAVVDFQGPVVVDGICADGSTNPDGLHLQANRLQMDRHPKTGEILKVRGQDVQLDWTRLRGETADLELDLRWKRILARDPGRAHFTTPDGRSFDAERILIHYETMAIEATNVTLEQRRSSEVPR